MKVMNNGIDRNKPIIKSRLNKKVQIHISISTKRGFARAFDIRGSRLRIPPASYFMEDCLAILSDWRQVGYGIREAEKKYWEANNTKAGSAIYAQSGARRG